MKYVACKIIKCSYYVQFMNIGEYWFKGRSRSKNKIIKKQLGIRKGWVGLALLDNPDYPKCRVGKLHFINIFCTRLLQTFYCSGSAVILTQIRGIRLINKFPFMVSLKIKSFIYKFTFCEIFLFARYFHLMYCIFFRNF